MLMPYAVDHTALLQVKQRSIPVTQSLQIAVAPDPVLTLLVEKNEVMREVMRLERHNGVLVVTITPETQEAARLFWEAVLQLAPPNTALVVSTLDAQ